MSSTVHPARSAHESEYDESHQLVAWSRLPPSTLMLMVGETERRIRFGHALHKALARRGMSQAELARRIAVDPRTISRWLKARDLPDIYQAQALADVLQVDEDLFRNPPERPPEPEYPIDRYLLENVKRKEPLADSG